MHTSNSRSTAGFLSLENKQAINVVMVYEDFATGLRAKRLYDDLCRQLEPECEVNQSMWKFEVLGAPQLGPVAADEAAEADMVIISMHGDGKLPRKVKAWMETWVGEKGAQGSALVALFDEIEDEGNEVAPIQAGLRQFARRSGMSFFAAPTESSEWDAVHAPQPTSAAEGSSPSLWADGLDYDRSSRHWGINE